MKFKSTYRKSMLRCGMVRSVGLWCCCPSPLALLVVLLVCRNVSNILCRSSNASFDLDWLVWLYKLDFCTEWISSLLMRFKFHWWRSLSPLTLCSGLWLCELTYSELVSWWVEGLGGRWLLNNGGVAVRLPSIKPGGGVIRVTVIMYIIVNNIVPLKQRWIDLEFLQNILGPHCCTNPTGNIVAILALPVQLFAIIEQRFIQQYHHMASK